MISATWFLKFYGDAYNFRPSVIFETETETETNLCQKDVLYTVDYANIFLLAVRCKLAMLLRFQNLTYLLTY